MNEDDEKEINKELAELRAQLDRHKKLKILKTRLSKGEITLEEFNKLKVEKPKKKITKPKVKKSKKEKEKERRAKNLFFKPKARGIATAVNGRYLEPDFLFDYSDDYCEKCGALNARSEDFCRKCGYELTL